MSEGTIVNLTTAIIVFFTIELVLRQCLVRLESISKYRIDSLSQNLRPSLRKIEKIVDSKNYSLEDIDELKELLWGIRPLPPKELTESLEKIDSSKDFISNEPHFVGLKIKIGSLIKTEKIYCENYCGPIGQMDYPFGISLIGSIIFFAIPFLWIPIFVVYILTDAIDFKILFVIIIISLLLEKNRRGLNFLKR